MKPLRKTDKTSLAVMKWIMGGAALVPSLASAIDWTGTTGSFGTGTNWNGGVVPSATTANIANGGTAGINGGDVFGVTALTLGNHAGTGFITQDGGALTATQVIIGGDNASGSTGQGIYSISGGSLSGTGNTEMWIGSKGGTGTLAMSGAAAVTNNNWVIVGRDGGAGNVTVGGTSELKSTGQNIGIAVNSPGQSSTITVQESGKLTSSNELYVGWLGNNTNQGTLVVKDNALVSVNAGLVVGRENGKGTMTVSNSATVNVGGFLVIGADGGGDGGNGTMSINDTSSVNVTQMIWLGQAGNSKGTLNINGGTTTSHANLTQDNKGASVAFRGNTGALNLNGGTLEATGFNKASGTASIALNGGTIKVTGNTNTGSYFNNFADSDLSVQAGGAKFDTNGNSITVTQSLSGAGGLTKSGAGTLTLSGANTYSGATTVSNGTLAVASTGSFANSTTLDIQSGATLDTTSQSGWTLATGQTLKGDGTVNVGASNTMTVGGGAILAPGASPGTLSVTGGLSFAAGSTFAVEIAPTTPTSDLVNLTGGLSIDPAATLALGLFGSDTLLAGGTKFVLVDYGTTWNGGSFSGLADDSTTVFGLNSYYVDYNDVSLGGTAFTLTAVPEPAAALLGSLGLLAIMRRRRTR
ncbi:MAG: autotransporter-associated beta strand repeat-containing protein [Verrucomicrobiota bacterium]